MPGPERALPRPSRSASSTVSFALAIVVFFSGLLFIILIHELGHYAAARAFGFKVQEYFVGFGPRVWSLRRGGIEYGVKALPLGGYVKIAGMNPYETVSPEDVPRSYGSKPIWQRALVIFAGPGSHVVVAAILFSTWLFFFGDPRTAPVVVDRVDATLNGRPGPAFTGGMRRGDVIVRIDGVDEPDAQQVGQILTSAAQHRRGEPLLISVRRGERRIDLRLAPTLDVIDGETIGRVGIVLAAPDPEPQGALGSIVGGVGLVGQSVTESFRQIGHVFGPQGIGRVFSLLFTDAERSASDATSVVGIGQQVGATGSAGDWGTVVFFLAFVTVFIGLLNLLPLPPFDGGHLAVLLIEKFRGRAVDMRKLIPVSAVVMAFFATFVLATVILDVTKPIAVP